MMTPTQDVFELVLLRPAVSPLGDHPTDALLTWRAPLQGERLIQVYVDGQLHEVTSNPEQRAMWLSLDRRVMHRVELLAVDAADIWRDLNDHLQTWSPMPRDAANLAVLRDEALPVETTLRVSVDGKLSAEAPLWPGDINRSGFGGLFGLGAFGEDNAAGLGLGHGALGEGPLGNDGQAWRFSSRLEAGEHDLTLEAFDAQGRAIATPLVQTQTLDYPPTPVRALSISSDFVLTWSTDDA